MGQELRIDAAQLTDTGQKRGHNEDFVGSYTPAEPIVLARIGRLYMVADGVGGAASGEVASEYAVRKILHTYYSSTEISQEPGERLRQAIEAANTDIYERNEWHQEERSMATTIVAALVVGTKLAIASLGDSRAYMIRNGKIQQITRDHSLVQKLVEEGSISPQEAEGHPRRNVVLRSLGVDARIYLDLYDGDLQPDDVLVLCSDGLTRHVKDAEIAEIATSEPAERATRRLVDLANARGGKDNISVVILQVTGVMPSLAIAGRPLVPARELVEPELETLQTIARERRRTSPSPRRSRLGVLVAINGFAFIVLLMIVVAQGLSRQKQPASLATSTSLAGTRSVSGVTTGTPMSTKASMPVPADTATRVPTHTTAPTSTNTATPTSTNTATPTSTSTAVAAATCDPAPKYTVVKGDVLEKIAEQFCVKVEELVRVNKIPDRDRIDEKQILIIPSRSVVPSSSPHVTPIPHLGDTKSRLADDMVIVYVPEGTFQMGSKDNDSGEDERPSHRVSLSAFWMDKTEVTNAQFVLFLKSRNVAELGTYLLNLENTRIKQSAGGYEIDGDYKNHPVTGITWEGARAYCEWAGARLPSEAEWEYAARGEAIHKYPWGSEEPDCEKAKYGGCQPVGTSAVGSYPESESWCGVLDLAGNVMEWVADWYAKAYYESVRERNPSGPESGTERVLRGGGWESPGDFLRTSDRYYRKPDLSGPDQYKQAIGFRCAQDID